MIVHEDYDGETITNDIAMLITQTEIEMSSTVATIALPTSSDSSMYDEGSPVTVIGNVVTIELLCTVIVHRS